MEIKNNLFLIIAAVFCFSGCATQYELVPYSFTQSADDTATITFVRHNGIGHGVERYNGVRLVDFESLDIPAPENETDWQRVTFPAGKPLNLRVFIYYVNDFHSERRKGIFRCPPLEAGKNYKLWNKGNEQLILTDESVKALRYSFGKPRFNSVYIQEIPPLPE
ncbi:MAG: hypothetical protein FWC03_07205 [Treponema sp.]|nr:hypothetical protein [Treponema sp.]